VTAPCICLRVSKIIYGNRILRFISTEQYTEWAESPCVSARSVLNFYLYCVGSGKWFSKSHTYVLCGYVWYFCNVLPRPWGPLLTLTVTVSAFTITYLLFTHPVLLKAGHVITNTTGKSWSWMARSAVSGYLKTFFCSNGWMVVNDERFKYVAYFAWRDWGKPRRALVGIGSLRAEFQSRDLPNKKVESWWFNASVRWLSVRWQIRKMIFSEKGTQDQF